MSGPDGTGPGPGTPPGDPATPPIFLERRSYRRRRVRDAARLLPVLGLLGWTVPLLWPLGAAAPRVSSALVYLFVVWAVLVAAGAALSVLLARGEVEEDRDRAARRAP
ncbi:hypothetical protein ATO8_15853 [Roseivivax marinus]|jgi:hypothetical protein|uniref:Uncharacterized protein n=1 Tax=Roseivivax marinus TaxID=1379903 RepID=W4HHV4_9RHOB|nr:hypothetical protein [Roseivivax marinus]ETW11736.1 hypothetical protein ATO8_15853 [Roseivivax marinus]